MTEILLTGNLSLNSIKHSNHQKLMSTIFKWTCSFIVPFSSQDVGFHWQNLLNITYVRESDSHTPEFAWGGG